MWCQILHGDHHETSGQWWAELWWSSLLTVCRRVSGNRWGVPLSGDRWTGPAAAEGGPSHGNHEYQTGPCTQDLCPDKHAERLVAQLSPHTHTALKGSSMTGQKVCAGDPMRWVQVTSQNCLMDVLSRPAQHKDISCDCWTHLLHWNVHSGKLQESLTP